MNSIISDMLQIGVQQGLSLEVHSSMKKIACKDVTPYVIIDSLKGIITINGSIVMAAFPLSKCLPLSDMDILLGIKTKNKWFSEKQIDKSDMGIVSDLFIQDKNTKLGVGQHRMAAWGKNADLYINDFNQFINNNGYALLIGVDIRKLTAMHYVENSIPENIWPRLFSPVSEEIRNIYKQEEYFITTESLPKYHIGWLKIQQMAEKQGLITRGKIGNAESMLFNVKDVISLYEYELQNNINDLFEIGGSSNN